MAHLLENTSIGLPNALYAVAGERKGVDIARI
jgi:hypothetical protein